MKIKNIIFAMLTESTGSAMCDSGGIYGRHWERNQKKTLADFEKEPSVSFEQPEQWYTLKKNNEFIRRDTSENNLLVFLQKYQPQSIDHALKNEGYTIEKETQTSESIDYTISLFHYLTSGSLTLDLLCEEYNALPCKDWDSEIYGVSKEQDNWIHAHGFTVGESFNSYNGESSLSQVIQGTYLKNGTDSYVLLQIHQGCDVRGGYTDAKLFLLPDEYMPSENVYGSIDGVSVSNWYDGYSLTKEDGSNGEAVPVNPQSVISLELTQY